MIEVANTQMTCLEASVNDGALKIRSYFIDNHEAHLEFRASDVRHSLADISKAQHLLGYQPSNTIAQCLPKAMLWYMQDAQKKLASHAATCVQ